LIDMTTITTERRGTAPRSTADCYRYLVDFSTCEQWDPAVYRAEKLTPGAPGPGTEFRVIVSIGPKRKTLRYRLDGVAPGERLELTGRGAGIKTRETLTLRPSADEAGTVIDYTGEFSLRGPLARAARFARPAIKRMTAQAMRGLIDALTVKTTTPRQGWASYLADRTLLPGEALYTDRGYFAMRDRSHAEFMDEANVAVTGATGGIGRTIAAEYARLGARVLLIGRNAERLAAAAEHVRGFAGCDPSKVETVEIDLASVAGAQSAGRDIARRAPRLDVLVNNAGALFDAYGETDDGFEQTLAINLIAPFVLTETVMAALVAAQGRVVNMSSGGMYAKGLDRTALEPKPADYSGLAAYARTKRALVALSHHWYRRYGDEGVVFNAMHPGWVDTPGVADALPRFHLLLRPILRDTRMGADTAVWLGSARRAAALNGAFVFDRTPRPTALLPGTAVKPSEAQSLYGWLRNKTGIDVHGLR
tara:strand:+ start:15848 stop:17281 length:1434 start_codon:yes stop_codon:yes gene_type:complete